MLSSLKVKVCGGINSSDIGAALDVSVKYLVVVKACYNVAVGHDNIVSVRALDEIGNAVESLKTASVHTAGQVAERRQQVKSAVLSCHIPLTAAAQVVEQ